MICPGRFNGPSHPTYPIRPVGPVFPIRPIEPRFPVRPIEPRFPIRPIEPRFPTLPTRPTYPVDHDRNQRQYPINYQQYQQPATIYNYQTIPVYSYQQAPSYSDYSNYSYSSGYQYPTNYQTTYYQQPTQTVAYNYDSSAYPTYVGSQSNTGGLTVSCYTDPSTASINQPITWSVSVSGGASPYTYSWSGSDGLSVSASSVTKFYSTTGQKTAIITISSSDGLTSTHTCDNYLTIRAGGTGIGTATQQPIVPQNQIQNGNPNAAAAAFSLSKGAFAWMAVLAILVLGSMIMYLLFERAQV